MTQNSLNFGPRNQEIRRISGPGNHEISSESKDFLGIKKIELLHLKIPFKIPFRHFLAARDFNDTLVAKVTLDNGTIGYGEGVPRKYLTQETIATDLRNAKILKQLINKELAIDTLEDFVTRYARHKKYNALLSAAELGILDALYRTKKQAISRLIGKVKHTTIYYSGIISSDSLLKVVALAYEFRRRKVKQVKIKVGTQHDEKRVKLVRKILGERIDLRVDANCAWTAKQAVEHIRKLAKYNISAVEQPVKASDLKGLKLMRQHIDIPIIVDESLINMQDAEKLLECADIYNIRISKCGGLLNSLAIYNFAKKHKKRVMLGCQVGETGILTAAGRALASCLDLKYAEGSYNRFLLKRDIVKENLTVREDFSAPSLRGNGLGVEINQRILNSYVKRRIIF